MEFSEKLVSLRKSHNLTQLQAAQKIGIQQSYLSKLENGRFIPSQDVIDKICYAYDIKPSVFSPPNKQLKYWLFIAECALALTVILIAELSLIYPEKIYTYQLEKPATQQPGLLSVKYHISEDYLGEKFTVQNNNSYLEYALVAQRTIARKENDWLLALGLIFVFVALVHAVFLYRTIKDESSAAES